MQIIVFRYEIAGEKPISISGTNISNTVMSSSREILREAIESGEEKNGNIEFKESLSKDIHLNEEKRTSLVAQLRHRVLSGDGEATYVLGVSDSGTIEGLSEERFNETVEVLTAVSTEAEAHISNVETWPIEDNENKIVGIATVQDGRDSNIDTDHIVVGTAGHVDHGKSTLVGSLVTGSTDNGEGGLRSYLDVQPHEVNRGLSADLSYAVYGFSDGEPNRLKNPDRNDERSEVVNKSDRLVSFVDTVGHRPWLRTTIRGLVGQRLDYGLLAVSADEGPTQTTREHLGVLLAMELPTIITITKTDLVSNERVNEVEKEIETLLRDVNCTAISETRNSIDTIVSDIDSNTIPVIRTSAVNKSGIDVLDELFAKLPKTRIEDDDGDFRMYIDKTYVVEGVGTVVSGTIMSGSVSVGDSIYLGPTAEGEFINTKARSIEIHYHQVEEATAGQLVSIAIRNISEEQVRRGMVLTSKERSPVREFEAEVMILNHPTRVTDGYEPVVHLETISETVQMDPDDPPLLPGDTGTAKMKFKFNPYFVEEGQRFVLREGESKGVGTVTKIIDRED